MEIVTLKLRDIIPYDKNPRKNDAAVGPVAESIQKFGFKVPIIVDRNNVIVAGHTRYKAAKKLGMDYVPCIRADDLTDQQVKAYRLADNKVSELAEWDLDLLSEELKGITDFNMVDFGFDLPEADPEEDNFDVDAAVEAIGDNPTSKRGQIWKLGRHRLLCGDSTVAAEVQKLTNHELMDMVFTDPPYNVDYHGKRSIRESIANDNMTTGEFSNFLGKAFQNYYDVLRQGAPFYVCYADLSTREFRESIEKAGLVIKQGLVWVKNTFVLGRQDYQWQHEPIIYGWKPGAAHKWYGGRKLTTIIPDNFPVTVSQGEDGKTQLSINIGLKNLVIECSDYKVVDKDSTSTLIYVDRPRINADHPTMKPILLCAKCIKNSSKQGDKVIDLFGGSGSTLIACEETNRQCYTMELDPVFCDVIIRRWEEYTGGKAELVG